MTQSTEMASRAIIKAHLPNIMKIMGHLHDIVKRAREQKVPESPDRKGRWSIGEADLRRHQPQLHQLLRRFNRIQIPLGADRTLFIDGGDHLLRSIQLGDRPYDRPDFWTGILDTVLNPPSEAKQYPYPLQRAYIGDRQVLTNTAIGYERKVPIDGKNETIHVRITPSDEKGDLLNVRIADVNNPNAQIMFISAFIVHQGKIGRPVPRLDATEQGLFRKSALLLQRTREIVANTMINSNPAKPVI